MSESTEPVASEVELPIPPGPEKVMVVATQRGALPITGLVQEGQRFEIEVEGFSASWMKPASVKDAAKLKKAKKNDA